MKSKFGACIQACIPVKNEASHKSEMVNQLIFGEIFEILEYNSKWAYIKSNHDNYCGWIENQQIFEISKKEFIRLQNSDKVLTLNTFSTIKCLSSNSHILLTLGSLLYDSRTFKIGNLDFEVNKNLKTTSQQLKNSTLIKLAKSCLNSPYLWGGRSVLGFDCSGFVQIIFRFAHLNLERDSSKQALYGEEITNFAKKSTFDLAFFGSNNKIDHVGIVLPNNQIIHCSGKVKIDTLNENGIFSLENKKLTHNLLKIKRYNFQKYEIKN